MSDDGLTSGSAKMALAVYALYALGAAFSGGLLTILGVILAYINRPDAEGTWVESHFQWQIRTFWISLLFVVIGLFTLIIGVGIIILILVAVWVLVRVAIGWSQLAKERPVPRPESWFF